MTRNDILQAAHGTSSVKEIKDLMSRDAQRIKTLSQMSGFAQKYALFMYFDTTLNTLKSRVSDVRNHLKNAGNIRKEIIDLYLLPTKVYTSVNNKAAEKAKEELLKNQNSEMDFEKWTLKTLENLISKIENSEIDLVSNNSNKSREMAYIKLIVVALATGRRQVEVLKTMSLSKKKDEAKYGGLVKKKSDDFSLVAPILADIKIVKKYLQDVRDEFKIAEMTNKEINSKYNASISKSLSRYLDPEIAEQGFHFLRAAYAEACFLKFGDNAEKNTYFSQILGHETDLNAAHNYQIKIQKVASKW